MESWKPRGAVEDGNHTVPPMLGSATRTHMIRWPDRDIPTEPRDGMTMSERQRRPCLLLAPVPCTNKHYENNLVQTSTMRKVTNLPTL
jgi:hypothetical protein